MTLDDMLLSGDRIPLPFALSILRQCAQQLDSAHESGLVHGSLTPARILVSEPGGDGTIHVEVKEYGASRQAQENLAVGLVPPEFAAYMSPEEILGTPADRRSDEFCLAVIGYEMLSGRKPFLSPGLSDLFFEICATTPPAPEQLNPELRPKTGVVLQQALAKDPTQRFQSCGEFIEKLEQSLRRVVPLPVAEPVVSHPAAIEAAAAATTFNLPPARRRVYGDEPDETPRPAKRRSSVLTFGLVALAVIALIALAARLLNWHPKPNLPVQVLDPHAGPATPPPAQSQSPGPPKSAPSPHIAPTVRKPEPVAAARGTHPTVPASASPKMNQSAGGVADVELLTQPPGARIIVDNQSDLSCISPCTLGLPRGRHVLSADLQGFGEARRIFYTPEDRSLLIAMNRSVGTLEVSSNPSGATLLLDGHDAGHTPTSLHLNPGQHRLDAFLGSQVQQRVVEIEPDTIQSMIFDLRNNSPPKHPLPL